jgi:LEA14-like dessication related protein
MPRIRLITLIVFVLAGLARAQGVPPPAQDPGTDTREVKRMTPTGHPTAKEMAPPVKSMNGNGAPPPKPVPIDPNAIPKIGCAKPQFDFGEAAQFEEVIHDYEIENVGKGELQIINVHGSCGCTAVVADKNLLAAGEKGKVNVKLSTQANQGPISKTVTVTTNDPATPNFVLTISGRVAQPFRPTVPEVNFGTVKKGDGSATKTFEVHTNSAQSIVEIKTDNDHVKAAYELLPATSKDQGYRITVTLTGPLPVGQLRAIISMSTTVAAQKLLTVPVLALVEGELALTPRTFNWGKVKRAEAGTKTVEVQKPAGAADLKIESVEVKPDGAFTTKLEEVEAGRKYRIVLGLAPEAKDGYSRATMTIKTNCPGETVLQVYFYALLQP